MNHDVTKFRQTATTYFMKKTDTEDKDNGVDEFQGTPTYKWIQSQKNPAIKQLGEKLIYDIGINGFPGYFRNSINPTLDDVDPLD